jgi:hypothetical protein
LQRRIWRISVPGEFGINGRLVTATPGTGEAVKVLFLHQSYLGAKEARVNHSEGWRSQGASRPHVSAASCPAAGLDNESRRIVSPLKCSSWSVKARGAEEPKAGGIEGLSPRNDSLSLAARALPGEHIAHAERIGSRSIVKGS